MKNMQSPLMASHRSNLKGLNMSDALELNSSARKSLLAVAVIGTLAGIAGTAAAAPTLFDATATVQNAVTITQTTPMTFGTVFVTKSAAVSAGAAADVTVAAPLSNKLILAPAGTITQGALVVGAPMLSLGSATAGSYSVPGLPSGSKVGLLVTNANATGTFANQGTAAHASCGYDNPAAALTAGKLVLSLVGGDPATTGFFCIDALTATVGATDVTATLLPTATYVAISSPTAATGYTLGFGATSLAFNLGGTLVQQVPTAGSQRTYEAGTYTGKIGLEVTFL
jgi:hypothetical protein